MDRVGGRTPHDDCELKPNTQTDLTSLQAEDGVPRASATSETRKTKRPRRPGQAKVIATMPLNFEQRLFSGHKTTQPWYRRQRWQPSNTTQSSQPTTGVPRVHEALLTPPACCKTQNHQQAKGQIKHQRKQMPPFLALTTLDADFKASSAFSFSCPQAGAISTAPRRFPGALRPLLPRPPATPFRVDDVPAASLRLRPPLPLSPPPPSPAWRALFWGPASLLPLPPLFPSAFLSCTQA